ncbi:reactive intermediate/imine deaminase [Gemmiger formicilis]|uniref:RidA family protein n=1 Tax=Gemmiger formicilis TaxID=745368 RepID=UPI001C026C33|nr:RidA family protein [Gemmiger formicilis]MBT9673212.1 reactive intermediate/imine deaminase [Gemmiger formicilis]
MTHVSTPNAPAALGPYSQAVDTGSTVYCIGQLGLDPATGNLADGVQAQTHQALKNLQAVLNEAGLSLDNVVKTTVFVQDLADFGTVNEIYGTYFHGGFPARSCVQIAALPKNALVEIECIAVR